MTRRDFLRFFMLGGVLALFSKKTGLVKAETRKAMFWRKIP